ncbi:prepilin peptidase [Actinomadura viridis]|uniref:prepilin peptidase n=1 Tax=Actinomadura viridis TaxID=58110 RepID=UPI00367A22E6
MGTEAVDDRVEEPSPGPTWSWRADWTAPVRDRPLPVLLIAVATEAALCLSVGRRPDLAAFLYLGLVGTLLGVIDAHLRRLPDPLTLPSYPAGMVLLGAAAPFLDGGGGRFVDALFGLAALWALFAVQWVVVPSALGFGDVKLSGVLGLYLGWLGMDAWVLGTFAMFVTGGLYAVGLLVLRRAKRKESMPFGPFMLLGALIGILVHA